MGSITVMTIVCSLLLTPMQPAVGFDAQDAFPIGQHFIYDSWIDIWDPPEAYGDTFGYLIEDWIIDQTNGTVNCTCMLPTGNETRIEHYQNIPVDILDNPPLMTNITTWFLGGVAWIGDDDYNIVNETRYIYSTYDGYIEIPCFRLMNITWSGDYENITILQYDSELGVLLSIFRETSFISNGSRVATADFFLVYSPFVSLLDVIPITTTSPSTTTTPTTPTTSITPTSPTTTSSHVSGTDPPSTTGNESPYGEFDSGLILSGVLLSAIAAEVVIIIVLIKRKYSISDL